LTNKFKLKNGSFKHVESELYAYHDTKREIEMLRNDILYGTAPPDENVGGGRSSLPGRPTENKAIALVTNRQIVQLEAIIRAIDEVVGQLPSDKRKLVELKYWTRPQMLTWDGIAMNLCISRRTAERWRADIVNQIGVTIGWR
jgi:RinA family phage transcriptional activator